MRKSLWIVAVLLLFAALGAPAALATPSCTSGNSLASYIALGASGCEDGDVLYDDFAYESTGSNPVATEMTIVISDDGALDETGLQFAPAAGVGDWTSSGFTVSYAISEDPSECAALYGAGDTCTITSAQGEFQGASVPNSAAVDDAFTSGGTIDLDDLASGDNSANLGLGPQPITSTNVVITGETAGESDPVDSFGLDVFQTVQTPSEVPEPGAAGLTLIGLALLTWMRKRAAKGFARGA